jgi:hypothetical protein
MPPDSPRLDYRSTRDAAGDDARAMRRSVRTWAVLAGVWAVGLGVWVVYLGMVGYLLLRLLA